MPCAKLKVRRSRFKVQSSAQLSTFNFQLSTARLSPVIEPVYIIVALSAYLLGSIPTGYLVGKAKGIDIRTVGSGNIGATNTFRTLGKIAGIFVLLVDAAKGWTAVRLIAFPAATHLMPPDSLGGKYEMAGIIAAIICRVLGHNYTCWLKFKGGKGIATTAGAYLALTPLATSIAFIVWIIVLFLTRYVSLASIAAAIALPIAVWTTVEAPLIWIVTTLLGVLAIFKHRGNIRQLLNGTENRLGKKTEGREMRITVLGAGAWGTALAKILHENGNHVTLWDITASALAEIQRGRNERYLSGVALPVDWKTEADFKRAIGGAECVVLAVPSQAFREVAAKLKGHPGIFVSVTKGIEFETGDTMSRILRELAPADRVVALSGPSFAREVALGIPTTVVCACESDGTAKTVQGLFHRPEFRIYRSTDVIGVEYGGALKNVIAIAAGVSDGLGYGDNTKAGLVTRAFVGDAAAGRGVWRAGGDVRGLERPWRSDVDLFFEAKSQSRSG